LLILFGLILIFRNRTNIVRRQKKIEVEIEDDNPKQEDTTYSTYKEQEGETAKTSDDTEYIDEDDHQSNFFGELNYKTQDKNFNGLNVSNVFGDINIDISDIDFDSGEQTVNISGVFGSIRIKIPPNIPVKFIGSNIAGSVKFKDQTRDGVLASLRSQAHDYNSSSKKVLIRASVIFGEIVAE
jgi:predicted membrane protein